MPTNLPRSQSQNLVEPSWVWLRSTSATHRRNALLQRETEPSQFEMQAQTPRHPERSSTIGPSERVRLLQISAPAISCKVSVLAM